MSHFAKRKTRQLIDEQKSKRQRVIRIEVRRRKAEQEHEAARNVTPPTSVQVRESMRELTPGSPELRTAFRILKDRQMAEEY